MDFRVENSNNKRMVFTDEKHEAIIDKMRADIENVEPISVFAETGTFVVLNNKKCLHARAGMINLEAQDICPNSRILVRSKGQKAQKIKQFELQLS